LFFFYQQGQYKIVLTPVDEQNSKMRIGSNAMGRRRNPVAGPPPPKAKQK
jgi:hypothetical protein